MIESVIPLMQIFLKEIISSILKCYAPSCLLALFIVVKNGTLPKYAAVEE